MVGGKIEYLGMVRGKEDSIYSYLKMKFDLLCKHKKQDVLFLEKVINVLDDSGVDDARNVLFNRHKNFE